MTAPASKADHLERRMISFSVEIIRISTKLPRNLQGQHIARQILRSGTAVAANYGEARGAESRSDFIHKLRIVLKELNETAVWLELILQTALCPKDTVAVLLGENRELCRIIAASIKTARHTSVQEI
jgi:four helix bundle protein